MDVKGTGLGHDEEVRDEPAALRPNGGAEAWGYRAPSPGAPGSRARYGVGWSLLKMSLTARHAPLGWRR